MVLGLRSYEFQMKMVSLTQGYELRSGEGLLVLSGLPSAGSAEKCHGELDLLEQRLQSTYVAAYLHPGTSHQPHHHIKSGNERTGRDLRQ